LLSLITNNTLIKNECLQKYTSASDEGRREEPVRPAGGLQARFRERSKFKEA